jgi:uncharacterized SAM-binding protein YcdF (DUF218 family)
MFFVASKIFDFLAAPSHLALFAAAVGVALCYTRFARWGRRFAAAGVLLLLAMSFGPIGQLLAVPLETRFPPPSRDMAPPDGIIVLGGTVDEDLSKQLDRVVLNSAVERLTAPIELMRRFPKARLVFTGGSARGFDTPATEAANVKRFWREMGIDNESVVYEDRSRNTYENALFTRDLVKPKPGERWLLVTSAIHMPRSVGIFRQLGFTVIPYPVDFRTNGVWTRFGATRKTPLALDLVDFAAHEWVGLLAYRLTGKTDALLPGP